MAVPPFLRKNDDKVGVVVSETRSDETEPRNLGLEAASEELLKAIERKDAIGVSKALTNAFMLMEAEPHEEAGE